MAREWAAWRACKRWAFGGGSRLSLESIGNNDGIGGGSSLDKDDAFDVGASLAPIVGYEVELSDKSSGNNSVLSPLLQTKIAKMMVQQWQNTWIGSWTVWRDC